MRFKAGQERLRGTVYAAEINQNIFVHAARSRHDAADLGERSPVRALWNTMTNELKAIST